MRRYEKCPFLGPLKDAFPKYSPLELKKMIPKPEPGFGVFHYVRKRPFWPVYPDLSSDAQEGLF